MSIESVYDGVLEVAKKCNHREAQFIKRELEHTFQRIEAHLAPPTVPPAWQAQLELDNEAEERRKKAEQVETEERIIA